MPELVLDDDSYDSQVVDVCCSYAGGSHLLDRFTFGFDTLASLGITDCLALFGGRQLEHDVTYEVSDWSSGKQIIKARGQTAFGPMLYHEGASGTILCAYDMVKQWDITWTPGKLECVATHRGMPGLRLKFEAGRRERLLTCTVDKATYDRICQYDPTKVSISYVLTRSEHEQALEAIRFHEASMHTSQEVMIQTLRSNVFADAPIRERAVSNICLAVDWPCPACAVDWPVR